MMNSSISTSATSNMISTASSITTVSSITTAANNLCETMNITSNSSSQTCSMASTTNATSLMESNQSFNLFLYFAIIMGISLAIVSAFSITVALYRVRKRKKRHPRKNKPSQGSTYSVRSQENLELQIHRPAEFVNSLERVSLIQSQQDVELQESDNHEENEHHYTTADTIISDEPEEHNGLDSHDNITRQSTRGRISLSRQTSAHPFECDMRPDFEGPHSNVPDFSGRDNVTRQSTRSRISIAGSIPTDRTQTHFDENRRRHSTSYTVHEGVARQSSRSRIGMGGHIPSQVTMANASYENREGFENSLPTEMQSLSQSKQTSGRELPIVKPHNQDREEHQYSVLEDPSKNTSTKILETFEDGTLLHDIDVPAFEDPEIRGGGDDAENLLGIKPVPTIYSSQILSTVQSPDQDKDTDVNECGMGIEDELDRSNGVDYETGEILSVPMLTVETESSQMDVLISGPASPSSNHSDALSDDGADDYLIRRHTPEGLTIVHRYSKVTILKDSDGGGDRERPEQDNIYDEPFVNKAHTIDPATLFDDPGYSRGLIAEQHQRSLTMDTQMLQLKARHGTPVSEQHPTKPGIVHTLDLHTTRGKTSPHDTNMGRQFDLHSTRGKMQETSRGPRFDHHSTRGKKKSSHDTSRVPRFESVDIDPVSWMSSKENVNEPENNYDYEQEADGKSSSSESDTEKSEEKMKSLGHQMRQQPRMKCSIDSLELLDYQDEELAELDPDIASCLKD